MSLTVVCTDKGTHPSRRLATLEDNEDSASPRETSHRFTVDIPFGTFRVKPGRPALPDDSELSARMDTGPTGFVYRFRCPTCRRVVLLREERLAVLVDRWNTDMPLDVSRLEGYA